ncbi:O-acetyl-ADP-ribose deacetylase (regulator of RNase III) [Bosea sp. OAE752]|uniref:hypothetical protein n=1 Tax=Bosea sp. OAE752 TaxID=2663873 RepID=UPI0013AEE365
MNDGGAEANGASEGDIAYAKARADSGAMNPFTVMRHCLYAADSAKFGSMLTDRARATFDEWQAAEVPEGG